MSLLIKALDKAQAEKAKKVDAAKDTDAEVKKAPAKRNVKPSTSTAKPSKTKATEQSGEEALSLSPADENLTQTSTSQSKTTKSEDALPAAVQGSAADSEKQSTTLKTEAPRGATQSQAANVFAAKQVVRSNPTAKIAFIIGLLALVLLGAVAYWYQTELNQPDIVVPPRPASFEQAQVTPAPLPASDAESVVSMEMETSEAADQANISVEPEAEEMVVETAEAESVNQPLPEPEPTVAPEPTTHVFESASTETSVEQTLAANETVVEPAMINMDGANDNASIEVVKKRTASEVDPVLMRAYEAYIAGNDAQAQTDYKQVLRQFGPNVDAMLGLGAIAARQGRLADAKDWYQKVLEIAPRNEIAKAGLLSLQQENQPQANESSIKSMLAVTPEDANLHAALGNIYAERGQWPAAQQAYFDAYRYHASAEHAFNLAVSLDQLGKPNLALPYYQEALQKADQSSVIDMAVLQARISAIDN